MSVKSNWVNRQAWLPIPLLVATMATLWVAGLRVSWPQPLLFWLIHYGSAVLGVGLISIPAARSFLATGQPSVLMLGCAVLMMQIGAASMPSGLARSTSTGFAIYNTSVLLSALCHFTGVAITSRRKIRLSHSTTWLAAAYAGSMAVMGLVVWGAFAGWLPVFFIDNQGGTLLRTLVVSMAVALFLLTASLLWHTNRRSASPFLYWYALGLILLAAGLTGSLLIVVKDSPLQWSTRFTQVFGVVYMCVAVLASAREAGCQGIPLAKVEDAWRGNYFLAGLRQQMPHGWVLRYGLAAGTVAAAMGLRLALTGWFGPGLPTYITFYPAIMVVALLAGFGPGLVATAFTGFTVAYWILPSSGQFAIASPVDRLALVIFTGMGLFMSVFAELYWRNRDKAAAFDREEALRESQARLAMFAEATFEGIVESEAGKIVDCNEQLASLLLYSVNELRGMEIRDLIAPEDRDRVMANIRWGRESEIEHALIRKDGTQIIVEARGRSVSPGIERRHTTIHDITERKRTEDALRDQAALLNLAHDAIIVRDTGDKIVFWNRGAEETYGWTPEEAMGQVTRDLLKTRFPKPLAEIAEDVAEKGRWEGELTHTRKDGQEIIVASRWAAQRDKSGHQVGVLEINSDITARKQIEIALRESEERLRLLGDNLPDSAVYQYVHESDGCVRFLYFSAGIERLNGVSAQLVLQDADVLHRQIPPEYFARLVEAEARSASDLSDFDMDVPMRRPDGQVRWMRLHSRPRWSVEDRVMWDGVQTDITARKRAEEQLRVTLESIGDGFFALDQEWRFVYVNAPAEHILGIRREDVLGKIHWDVFPLTLGTSLEREFHYAAAGEARDFENFYEPWGRWFHNRCFPREGGGISVYFQDITGRKRVGEALRQSEERLRLALDAGAMATWDWTLLDGKVIWNDAYYQMLGYEPGMVHPSYEAWAVRIHPDDFPMAANRVHTSLEQGSDFNSEFRVVRPDGTLRWIEVRGRSDLDMAGQPLRNYGVMLDVTERKKSEETLKKLNEELENRVAKRTAELREKDQMLLLQSRQAAMGEMIGNIAHQWRQPLNSLGLTIQQLLLFYELGEFNREFLDKSVLQSMELINHMSKTIEDFRNYFRPDKEKVEFKMNEAIAKTLSLIEDSFKNQHIRIEVFAKDDPAIYGYPNEFAQALLNILNNARDALTEREIYNPSVTISTCIEGNRSVVIISDNAGGIAEEIIGKIFDPYFTTKGPQLGTGVGLYMSKTIIERNIGGRLAARNNANGAEFRIEV